MGTRTSARTAGRSSSPSFAKPPRHTPAAAHAGLALASAKTGDHVNILQLLQTVFHGPPTAEFYAQLDEPGYDPADRLVVKDGSEIVAHLRLARQTISLDGQSLAAARFMDLATAEAYRGRGLATAMLASGQRLAAQRGALVGLVRTRAPQLFARQGWALCGRHLFSAAPPRAILAELSAARFAAAPEARTALPVMSVAAPISVRPMRRIDLPAIVRIYRENAAGLPGCPLRSEEYWEWLLSRGSCDQIYIATTLPEPSDLAAMANSIIGYAFVRQCRIVEMFATSGREDVCREILARVCADASERDEWLVRCDLRPGHEVYKVLSEAGGELMHCRELAGEVFMAKLLDPLAALRAAAPALYRRTRLTPAIARPTELGFELLAGRPGARTGIVERYRLQIGQRTARVETGGPSRHSISLSQADLAPLLLGDGGAEDFLRAGKLTGNTPKARQLAAAIFPPRQWWRPVLDDLTAFPL